MIQPSNQTRPEIKGGDSNEDISSYRRKKKQMGRIMELMAEDMR